MTEELKECKTCGSGGCSSTMQGLLDHCNKLTVFDWLTNLKLNTEESKWVEVRFKNTRKEFYYNAYNLPLYVGDMVLVEGNPGKDVGMVTVRGNLAEVQMKKKGININPEAAKKIIRKARQQDIELWKKARMREHETMLEARKIAREMKLDMKISDVEFQGDNTKAIFYYIADQRVDFRELIKVYAQTFSIKVEMRQIGTRQEAALVGGIGSCGRELCCSTWLTDFRSVTTTAARYQQLSLNPQKLAGQCGKLKCCLNFELDLYVEALKKFPNLEKNNLKFQNNELVWFKNDIFKKLMWFYEKQNPSIQYAIPLEEVNKVVQKNKDNIFPEEIPLKISSSGAVESTDKSINDISQVLDEADKQDLDNRLKNLKKTLKKSVKKNKHKPQNRKQ
jgi:cell fate regulator YaaT (PSP1 superfamily)